MCCVLSCETPKYCKQCIIDIQLSPETLCLFLRDLSKVLADKAPILEYVNFLSIFSLK